MTNGITAYFKFSTFFYVGGVIIVALTLASLLFQIDLNTVLTDFNRGFLSGVLALYLLLIFIHVIDTKFHVIQKNQKERKNNEDNKS